MIIDGFGITAEISAYWNLVTALARSQPLGGLIVLLLLADGVLGVVGALADRWEGVPSIKVKLPPANHNGAKPTLHGPAPGR